jgi:hypothetical protein
MKIFLSYSSKQQALAEEICLGIEQSGHSVFYDKKSLRAGRNFRRKIREELDKSEMFVFLISPDSVSSNSYTMSELEIAREKWPRPEAHVLPVMIITTKLEKVPPYLKAVTILEPEGDIVEAVCRSIDNWSPMVEVDQVADAQKTLEEHGVSPSTAGLLALGIAIGNFEMEVLERGMPNKTYRQRIKGIVKGYGKNARLVPELTEYKATAGREYKDDLGSTCREVTVTFNRDGEWITQSDVFCIQRGKWVRAKSK